LVLVKAFIAIGKVPTIFEIPIHQI
jgi:hypothetical protein